MPPVTKKIIRVGEIVTRLQNGENVVIPREAYSQLYAYCSGRGINIKSVKTETKQITICIDNTKS